MAAMPSSQAKKFARRSDTMNLRHSRGLARCVELVEIGARPAIGAVVRDENRQIAHDGDALDTGKGCSDEKLSLRALAPFIQHESSEILAI